MKGEEEEEEEKLLSRSDWDVKVLGNSNHLYTSLVPITLQKTIRATIRGIDRGGQRFNIKRI